jgi:tRNA dimethylallyltransferase
VAILGPTASGKSTIAEGAAELFGASILSVDSMQVYRGMDVGTAKPSSEVRERITHHMIDIADPSDDFSVKEFQKRGREALEATHTRSGRILIAGGSGLHFRSLVDPMTFEPTDSEIRRELEQVSLEKLQSTLLGIDAAASEVVDVQNARRVVRAVEIWQITGRTPTERARSPEAIQVRSYTPLIDHVSIGVDSADASADRVDRRFSEMLRHGLLDEVRSLTPQLGRTASQALGYKQLSGVVRGTTEIGDATREAVRATNALVKRQRTFFRRDPRIEWLPWQDDEDERIATAVRRVGEVAGWTS